MARTYELIYVLNPTIGEEAIETANQRVRTLIEENNGTVVDTEVWGLRRLAYEIQDKNEGYYVLLHFSSEAELPKELERVLKIMDSVLRFLVTRVDE